MIGDGCFLAGTPVRVATALGQHDRPVETLQPGESVVTATGPLRVVAVEKLAPPPGPGGATIHLLPGALGPGRPRQDLVVTPEQLLFVQDEALPEGALAPAGALVNGRSILRAARTEQTPWYGVTLEGHGLPLVANLPAASRRDAGGALSARLLPPGPALFALRGRLTRAATAEAPPPPAATPEPPPAEAPPDDLPPNDLLPNDLPPGDLPSGEAPDLRLVADGRTVLAQPPQGGLWRFTIPAGAASLRLVSPVGYPPNRDGGEADARRFGVAIQSILLDGVPLDLGGLVAGDGFHGLETRERRSWRWTDGNAQLILPPCPRPRLLDVAINDWHRLLRRG